MGEQPCDHKVVHRSLVSDGYVVWLCDDCETQFIPSSAFAEIENENDRILDMVTGVFSATLWDLHQRAYEAKQVTEPPVDKAALAASICEEKGHLSLSNTGECQRCGFSPFLGAKE